METAVKFELPWNGTGAITYTSRLAFQNENAFPAFIELFNNEKFDAIIELGTADGGVTLFLRDNLNDCEIHTFDVNTLNHFNGELFHDINIYTQNIFSGESINLIKSIIENNRVLVLCDGGDKIREFNTFAKMIKPGDFIMAHDYCDTQQNFDNNIKDKFWLWCEIWDAQIQDGLSHVRKYTKIDFTNAVWLCAFKE